ncbi:MAG: tetratricopeptide repeat protein, partial [Myxococcales bacterium]|nr:tetratricopeptide repeat protein [Myxococcales bacterium]
EPDRQERRLAALEGAAAIHPRSVEIHTLAGETALALGRPDLALDHYRRGTAIAPKDPDALLGRAFAEQQLGRGDAAMATYRALLELREDPAALNNLGAALAARGELVEARRLFERVLAATSPATSREAAHRREAEQNLAIIEQLMRR